MKTVISAKDIEDLLRQGGDLKSLPADAMSLEALVSSLGMPADRIQIAMVGLLEKLSPLVQK